MNKKQIGILFIAGFVALVFHALTIYRIYSDESKRPPYPWSAVLLILLIGAILVFIFRNKRKV